MLDWIKGALVYCAFVFPWAVVWHLVLFRDLYIRMGYFDGDDPSLPLGFAAIFTQGFVIAAILTALAPEIRRQGARSVGLKAASVVGVYHWSCHVVAAAAKHPKSRSMQFAIMESLYLAVQFAVGCVLLAWFVAGERRKKAQPKRL